jgi:hypothetical protein
MIRNAKRVCICRNELTRLLSQNILHQVTYPNENLQSIQVLKYSTPLRPGLPHDSFLIRNDIRTDRDVDSIHIGSAIFGQSNLLHVQQIARSQNIPSISRSSKFPMPMSPVSVSPAKMSSILSPTSSPPSPKSASFNIGAAAASFSILSMSSGCA